MTIPERQSAAITAAVMVALLLLLMVLHTRPEVQEQDLIEVQLGLVAAAPAAPASTSDPRPPQPNEVSRPTPTRQPASASNPVRSPRVQTPPSQERVAAPNTERREPRTQGEREARETPPAPPQPTPTPPSGGQPTENSGTNTQSDGPGEVQAGAGFDISGLNRTAIRTRLPTNSVGARATFSAQIIVAPDGSVTLGRTTRVTGNPTLDAAARRALLAWRFNRLPADAPQADQVGVITFRFTVRD